MARNDLGIPWCDEAPRADNDRDHEYFPCLVVVIPWQDYNHVFPEIECGKQNEDGEV